MQFRHRKSKRVVTATGDDAKPYQSDPIWDRIDTPAPVAEETEPDSSDEQEAD